MEYIFVILFIFFIYKSVAQNTEGKNLTLAKRFFFSSFIFYPVFPFLVGMLRSDFTTRPSSYIFDTDSIAFFVPALILLLVGLYFSILYRYEFDTLSKINDPQVDIPTTSDQDKRLKIGTLLFGLPVNLFVIFFSVGPIIGTVLTSTGFFKGMIYYADDIIMCDLAAFVSIILYIYFFSWYSKKYPDTYISKISIFYFSFYAVAIGLFVTLESSLYS